MSKPRIFIPLNHTYSRELISLLTYDSISASSIGYCLFRCTTSSSDTPESLHFIHCLEAEGSRYTRDNFYLTYISFLLSFSQEDIEDYKLTFIQEFNKKKFTPVDPWDKWTPDSSLD